MAVKDCEVNSKSHPIALWGLSIIYGSFTLSLGVFFANLSLFLNERVGLSSDEAFSITAAFLSLIYTIPLLGGFLCDKFGFRNATSVGLSFSFLGMFCISIPGYFTMLLGLSLFLVGNGLCTPALWSLVGMLYHKHDNRRETGSTIFYILFNIGFLLANFCSGFVIEKIGYSYTFLIFGSPLILGIIAFNIMRSRFATYTEIKEGERHYKGNDFIGIISLIVISIVLTPVCYFLLNYVELNNILIFVLAIGSLLYLFKISRSIDNVNSKRLVAFIALCIIAVVYFIIFNSEFDLLPVYVQSSIDRNILGTQLPASIITSLDPAYCLVFGTIYGILWAFLEKRNKNPALPTKFSTGLIFASLGYLVLSLLVYININTNFSILWLLLVFVFFVLGELLIFPIGISMTGKLSPEGKEGFCMGVWNLMIGSGAVLMGYMADFTTVPKTATISQINTQYLIVFSVVGGLVLALGIIMFCFKGLIKRLL